MKTQQTFCEACQRRVRLVVPPASAYSGQAVVADQAEVVCLDFGDACPSSGCPVTGLPRLLMGVRLAQSGWRPEALQRIRVPCRSCGLVTEFELLDAAHARCCACGARHRLVHVQTGSAGYLALTVAPD